MSDEEEELTPVRAFLEPLNLGQHRGVLKRLGYDDPTDFAAHTTEDAQEMKDALKEEGVPIGHVSKIMRAGSGGSDAHQSYRVRPEGVP